MINLRCIYYLHKGLNYKWMRKSQCQTNASPGQVHQHAREMCTHGYLHVKLQLLVLRWHFPCGLLPSSGNPRCFLYTSIYVPFVYCIRPCSHWDCRYYSKYAWQKAEYLQRPLLETMTEILVSISATIPSNVHCRSNTPSKPVLCNIWNK